MALDHTPPSLPPWAHQALQYPLATQRAALQASTVLSGCLAACMGTWASTAGPAKLAAAMFQRPAREQTEVEQHKGDCMCFAMLIRILLRPFPLLQTAAMKLLQTLVADPTDSAGVSHGDIEELAHGFELLAKRWPCIQSTFCTELYTALDSAVSSGLQNALEAHSGLLQVLELLALAAVAMPLHGDDKGCALLDAAWHNAEGLLVMLTTSAPRNAADVQSEGAYATQVLQGLLRLLSIDWVQRQKKIVLGALEAQGGQMCSALACLNAILKVPTMPGGVDGATREV
jgi:hypothetical protein